MADVHNRLLEKQWKAGDAEAGIEYMTRWEGRVASEALAEQVRAGCFWVEPVQDEYLGDAWRFYNLPVNGTKYDMVYGRGPLADKKGEVLVRTAKRHLDFSVAGPEVNPGRTAITSMLVEGSVVRAMANHEAQPQLRPFVQQYFADNCDKWYALGNFPVGHQCVGLLSSIDDDTASLSGLAQLHDIALDGTIVKKTVPLPRGNCYLSDRSGVHHVRHVFDRLGFGDMFSALMGDEYALAIEAFQAFTLWRQFYCEYFYRPNAQFPLGSLVLSGGFSNSLGVELSGRRGSEPFAARGFRLAERSPIKEPGGK